MSRGLALAAVLAFAAPLVGCSSMKASVQPVGKGAQSFSPEVLEVERGRRIVWRGRLVMPGLFDGRHTLVVEPLGANRSKFTQDESFSGMLVPFAGFDPYRAGWEKMNAALKARAERMAVARGGR